MYRSLENWIGLPLIVTKYAKMTNLFSVCLIRDDLDRHGCSHKNDTQYCKR